jgi:hypothetical protein
MFKVKVMKNFGHLSDGHRVLVSKYGLDVPNDGSRERILNKLYQDPRAHDKRSEMYRAIQLATVHPSKYGRARSIPTPHGALKQYKWKDSKNYQRQILESRKKGDSKRVNMLKLAHRARVHNSRIDKKDVIHAMRQPWHKEAVGVWVEREGARMKKKKMMRNVQKGIVSHRLTYEQEVKVADEAFTRVVGAVQDFMRMCGVSLSQVLYRALVIGWAATSLKVSTKAKAAGAAGAVGAAGFVAAGVPQAAIVGGAALSVTPDFIFKFVIEKLASFVVGSGYPAARWSEVASKGRQTIKGIIVGKDVDLRPLASAFVRALNPESLKEFVHTLIQDIMDTYVRKAYVSSKSKTSTMCVICKASKPCSLPRSSSRQKNNVQGLERIIAAIFKSINQLLALEGEGTLTSVARQALGSNIPKPIVQIVGSTPVQGATMVITTTLRLLGRWTLPFANNRLRILGLEITPQTFDAILSKHMRTLFEFLRNKPGVNIEPFIIDIVSGSQPMGIIRGLLGGSNGSELCSLCKTVYSGC